VLQTSKLTSEEVSKALEVAEATEAQIDTVPGYRPVSARASLLYFVLNDLQNVDPMYQFSLDAYRVSLPAVHRREQGRGCARQGCAARV